MIRSMAGALFALVGFFMLSVGWYGWRLGDHGPSMVFGVIGVMLLVLGGLAI